MVNVTAQPGVAADALSRAAERQTRWAGQGNLSFQSRLASNTH